MNAVTGKYRKYSEYQFSGISWARETPSHWKIKRFKNIFRIRKRIAGELGHDILSITQKGIKVKDTESGDGQLSMDYSKYQLVNPGDFAMNHMDLLTGYVDVSKYSGVTSPDYRVFTIEDEASDKRYFLYLLQLCYAAKIFFPLGQGAAHIGRWRLPTEAFSEFRTACPTFEEQVQIADFLDREIVRIDTLTEEQQSLIRLLKEKRQAVISHAVTKGLNPDVPMKDSGVEWLGEVPEHWKVAPLMSVADVIDPNPSHRNPTYTEDGLPFISTVEFTGIDDVETDTPRRVAEETVFEQEQRCKFQEGSMAFSRKGTIGDVRILPHNLRFALLDSVCVINCSKNLNYRFLYQQIRSSVFDSQLGALTRGAALKQISVGRVRNIKIFVPPLTEQTAIIEYLFDQLSHIDETVNDAKIAIELMQERRTALISAAVTGKIDVRDWVAPS
ncbi:restriction endonuclease subunit S [Endozoicomonas sp. ALB032]|uniref:restriction endonuclease subunit S n=1 Tax=Endozoicomonas sp. ALB032 TaxID=3403082 RepID=UPI003BB57F7F